MLNTLASSLVTTQICSERIALGDIEILARLSDLMRETFLLWDEPWVDFSWRHYYYEHTQRVRALALEIGRARC